MFFSLVVGFIINYKKGLLDLREGLFVAFGGLMGVILGSFILKIIDDKILMVVFVVVVCYIFIKYVFFSNKKFKYFEEMYFDLYVNNKMFEKKRVIFFVFMDRMYGVLMFVGFVIGIFFILLGMGGGILMVLFLGYFLKYDFKKIVFLGLFFVVFVFLFGVIFFYNGRVFDNISV